MQPGAVQHTWYSMGSAWDRVQILLESRGTLRGRGAATGLLGLVFFTDSPPSFKGTQIQKLSPAASQFGQKPPVLVGKPSNAYLAGEGLVQEGPGVAAHGWCCQPPDYRACFSHGPTEPACVPAGAGKCSGLNDAPRSPATLREGCLGAGRLFK